MPIPLRFIVVGFLNTATSLFVIYSLVFVFDVHNLLANAIGYALGVSLSFFLNRRWTFSFNGDFGSAALRFVATILVAYLANLGTVSFSLYLLGLPSFIAQATGVPAYAAVTYFGSRYFVFKTRSKGGAESAVAVSCSR